MELAALLAKYLEESSLDSEDNVDGRIQKRISKKRRYSSDEEQKELEVINIEHVHKCLCPINISCPKLLLYLVFRNLN